MSLHREIDWAEMVVDSLVDELDRQPPEMHERLMRAFAERRWDMQPHSATHVRFIFSDEGCSFLVKLSWQRERLDA